MEAKKDILLRTYFIFIGLSVLCLAILVKILYIQLAEGSYWKDLADKARIRMEEIEAERGSIYSADGAVLSTSLPEFDIYVDYAADGLRENDGKLFKENLDSLARGLALLFKDKKATEYKRALQQGYKKGDRYALLKRKISFTQYEDLKQLPLVRLGKNKSGFIAEVRMKRLYPFKLMANRTVGIARDSNKVGLERQFDEYLRGVTGRRLVRYIAGGTMVPVDDAINADPIDGADLVTNIDIGIQDIAHQALERMMVENEALHGTCIVMEVATGKVRAIANLGRQPDGSYWEDYNYALAASEPGSTWKVTTMMAALEDKYISLESKINLEGGRWKVNTLTVFDSEVHGLHETTVQRAFEKSSNVGMAKLTQGYYGGKPSRFINYLKQWGMDTLTGIDLPGEAKPRIYKPGTRNWSATTLPWMGFGYNLTITPMHTAMLYNAIANNGKMMKPYLVDAVVKEGEVVKTFAPQVVNNAICSPQTLAQIRACLEGVVLRGTAYRLQTEAYTFAGKTGTSLVADKGVTYADKMYQSSFAGYFPADNPEYTIVVVIRNKKHASKFYGGVVAGPVFREVADRLYARHLQKNKPMLAKVSADSVRYSYAASRATMEQLAQKLNLPYRDSAQAASVVYLQANGGRMPVLKSDSIKGSDRMPSLIGVGLKDALAICEENGWELAIKGRGKVIEQSVPPGTPVRKGQTVQIVLDQNRTLK